jgi:hypothetical protein
MRRRRLIQALLSAGLLTVLMILTTPKTYADNCGSLNDCFQTQGTAALVIVGIAVLIAITVLALPSLLDATKSPVPAEPPVLATWDIRSQTRHMHQPDFPFLSLYPCEIEGTAWRIEHRFFRLKSSMDENASRTRQKRGMFVSFSHTRAGDRKNRDDPDSNTVLRRTCLTYPRRNTLFNAYAAFR